MYPSTGGIRAPVVGFVQLERISTLQMPSITRRFTNQPCKKGTFHSQRSNAGMAFITMLMTLDSGASHADFIVSWLIVDVQDDCPRQHSDADDRLDISFCGHSRSRPLRLDL